MVILLLVGRLILVLTLLQSHQCCTSAAGDDQSFTSVAGDDSIGAKGLEYAVLMDAGSTGTRLTIYQFAARKLEPSPGDVIEDVSSPISYPELISQASGSLKVNPGISSYQDNPEEAGPGLKPLLDFARDSLGDLGVVDVSNVPVFLGATAGMRVLPTELVDSILASIRDSVRSEGFLLDEDNWVNVISGEQEGVYGWLTVNWIFNTWEADADSIAAIDMGGASVQITFRPENELILDSHYDLAIGDEVVGLYTHSFLYFGFDQAFLQYKEKIVELGYEFDPCQPLGLNDTAESPLPGASNSSGCAEAIWTFLPVSVPCFQGDQTECSMLGVYQPEVPPDMAVYVMGFPKYVWELHGLPPTASLSDLEESVTRICAMNVTEFDSLYGSDPLRYNVFCFGPWYTIQLFHKVFGLSMDRPLQVMSQVNGTDMGWSYGAMVAEVNQLGWDLVVTDEHEYENAINDQTAIGRTIENDGTVSGKSAVAGTTSSSSRWGGLRITSLLIVAAFASSTICSY